MNVRNRFLPLLLVAAGAFAFGACADSGAETDSPEAGMRTAEANRPAEDASHGAKSSDPVEAALVRAKSEGKNVLVEYWSDSCPYCVQMEEETLSSTDVKEALGGVVYVRVKKEKDHRPFTTRWPGAGTPSYAVLEPSGEQVGNVVSGVVAKANFVAFLDWAESGEGSQPSFNVGGT